MNNETIWLILILTNFCLVLVAFAIWGKPGLFVFAAVSIILANIQALEQVNIFGLNSSMGDINYIAVYLISDILSENYGRTVSKKIIPVGIFVLLSTTTIMQLALKLQPNEYDYAYKSLDLIFNFMPRVVLASCIAFFISQAYDVAAYQFWRKLYPDYKFIWIRNCASTLVSQLIDNAIFITIAFWGIFPVNYLWQIFLTSCLLRGIIVIIDTPFVYLSVKIANNAACRKYNL